MAPVEAMSQGVIPILPLKSGLAELLTNDDDDELVKYILKVLSMDRVEHLKYRKRVYRKASYFTLERFVNNIVGYLGPTKS